MWLHCHKFTTYFYSRNSNLTFREEFPIARTRVVVFILAIEVAGNDLYIDGIVLLIVSLALVSLTPFSALGDIRECEGVEWGTFDVIAIKLVD